MRTRLLGGAWCALLCALAACNGSKSGDSTSAGSTTSAAMVPVALTGSTDATAATPSVSARFGIKVSGNKLVSTLDGSTVHLVGSAVSGLDGSAGNSERVWAGFPATTVATWQKIKATWSINVIRLPLNSSDWLGLTGLDPFGNGNAGRMYHDNGNGTYTADPNHVYQGYVRQTIANIVAAGMYVLIDLHTDSPSNAAGTPFMAMGEPSFLGENALAFWTQMAALYKDNPAIMFDLHNEPYGDNVFANWFGYDAMMMRDGGQFPNFLSQDAIKNDGKVYPVGGRVPLAVIGKQAIVNAIRATGATNVILDSPMGWAGNIQDWMKWKPTDPIGQIGAAWHVYGYNNGRNSPIPPIAVMAAGFPVVITENEGFDAAFDGGKRPDAYTWAAANIDGCLQWGWNNWAGAPNLNSLVTTNPWTAGGAPAP
jgi:endoglucanase